MEVAKKLYDQPDMIKIFARDPAGEVRAVVAEKCSQPRIWRMLSRDRDKEVRRNLAMHCKKQEILKRLSTDKDWEVRETVCRNEATSLILLRNLLCEPSENIAFDAAARFLNMGREKGKTEPLPIRILLARYAHEDYFIALLTEDSSEAVRVELAQRGHINDQIMAKLERDKSDRVVEALQLRVAQDYYTPISKLEKLRSSPNRKITMAARATWLQHPEWGNPPAP